jgi:xanthine dehydrogenase YagS FAD-binding subunit
VTPFDYRRASSLAEALELGRAPGSRYLAGGTNLVDLMKYGVEAPRRLVDVSRLPLGGIAGRPGGGLSIGALATNAELAADPRVVRDYPVLAQALLAGASPQLRHLATTAGNLLQRTRCYYFYDTAFACNKRSPGSGCAARGGRTRIHAVLGQSEACIATHPSDLAVALLLLDAVVHVEGPGGPRDVPLAEFHRLPGDRPELDTTLAPGELITRVDLPALPLARRSAYLKVRDRAQYAFALVSAAVALDVDGGRVRDARFAFGGLAHRPWRVREAEQALVGGPATPEAYRAAAERALAGARGEGDNDFKVELARRTLVRAFEDLATGAAA